MVPVASLAIPILISAVFVFLASWLVHMLLPFHRGDFKKVQGEDDLMEAIRRINVPPGDYMIPHAGSPEGMRSKEFQEKFKKGPVLHMTVMKHGTMNMGPQLLQWFVYCVVVSVFAAYMAGSALGPGASYLHVFRFAGCAAFMGYAVALWQDSIWYRRNWGTTFRNTIDGLLYGCLTAGTLGWLWPKGM
jgi:hypothetical protein